MAIDFLSVVRGSSDVEPNALDHVAHKATAIPVRLGRLHHRARRSGSSHRTGSPRPSGLGTQPAAAAHSRIPGGRPRLVGICLFLLFNLLYGARWVFFYDGAKRVFGHSVVSIFFGAIPMGLATIINGFLVFGVSMWGDAAVEGHSPEVAASPAARGVVCHSGGRL
jgi:hypothetical protein